MDNNSYVAFGLDTDSHYARRDADAVSSLQLAAQFGKHKQDRCASAVLVCSAEVETHIVEVDEYEADMPYESDVRTAVAEREGVEVGDALLSVLPIQAEQSKPTHFLVSLVKQQPVLERLKVLARQGVFVEYVVNQLTLYSLIQSLPSCPKKFVLFDIREGAAIILVFSAGKVVNARSINPKFANLEMFQLKLKTLLHKYHDLPIYWLGDTDGEMAKLLFPLIAHECEIKIKSNQAVLSEWGLTVSGEYQRQEIPQILATTMSHDNWLTLPIMAMFSVNGTNLPKKVKALSRVIYGFSGACVLVIVALGVFSVSALVPESSKFRHKETKQMKVRLEKLQKIVSGRLFLKPKAEMYRSPLYRVINVLAQGKPTVVWIRYVSIKEGTLKIGVSTSSEREFKVWLKTVESAINAGGWLVSKDDNKILEAVSKEQEEKSSARNKKLDDLRDQVRVFTHNMKTRPYQKERWLKLATNAQNHLDSMLEVKKNGAFSLSAGGNKKDQVTYAYMVTAQLNVKQPVRRQHGAQN